MINVFYGRENINKEGFIYRAIANKGNEALVIVPDQYTLEAEKQALKYLNSSALIKIEISTFSRIGRNLLKEVGGDIKTFVDKNGRYILLRHIIKQIDDLEAFGAISAKDSFSQMVSDFISQMKQYNVSEEDLRLMEEATDDQITKRKLKDIRKIFQRYREALGDRYTDSEDLIDLYGRAVGESKFLEGKDVWIFGFDSFSPKLMSFIEALSRKSDINVVLTWGGKPAAATGLFAPAVRVLQQLTELGRVKTCAIGEEYEYPGSPSGIETIEKRIFSTAIFQKEKSAEGVSIVKSANIYNEIEGAAAFLLHLIRDKGYRYRDVCIICNDEEVRIPAIKRIFKEYGMDVFVDERMKIINSPLITYILSLSAAVAGGLSGNFIIKAMKSGRCGLEREQWEELEDYAIRFNIRGTMWKKPFSLGEALTFDKVDLKELNRYREILIEPFVRLEALVSKAKKEQWTYEKLAKEYYLFISALPLKVIEEERQIWQAFVDVIDQIVRMLGDERADFSDFLTMVKTGLEDITIGELPPTVDDVILGNMQRTRTPRVKAVLIIGANEGLLPMEDTGKKLFTDEEISALTGIKQIGNLDIFMRQEEKLGIYRNLSKAMEALRISYSIGDGDGEALLPSEIVEDIKSMFDCNIEEEDAISIGDTERIIGGVASTINLLSSELILAKDNPKYRPAPEWRAVSSWYEENEKELLDKVRDGVNYSNQRAALDREIFHKLYDTETGLTMTPYKLEAMNQCPFKYFFQHGLQPRERRIYSVDSRALGDMYHLVMEEFSKRMDKDGLGEMPKTSATGSLTADISNETGFNEADIKSVVDEIINEKAKDYQEALFTKDGMESYKLRRIRMLSYEACKALWEYRRGCDIVKTDYEIAFGRNSRYLKPIEVNASGQKIIIQGKIDRVDHLSDGSVSVIDYKTGGGVAFDENLLRAGYSMQLFIYLMAADGNLENSAGAFYMKLIDRKISLKSRERATEKVGAARMKSFLLDGKAKESAKKVISEALLSSRDSFSADEDFLELQRTVADTVEKICTNLIRGDISPYPMKIKENIPCTYCSGKDTCRFDVGLPGCKYNYK